MYLLSSRYDVLVTVSHRPLYVVGVLRRLLGTRGAAHLAKEICLDQGAATRRDVRRGLRRLAKRWAGPPMPPDLLLVNAEDERVPYAAALGLPPERVRHVPWPSNLAPAEEPVPGKGYVLGAGRSQRDWPTLLRAAELGGFPLCLVARGTDVAGLEVPEHVTVHTDIPHDEYVSLLRDADAVVIPLHPVGRSAGQACLLEAMAMGKPLVVSDVLGMSDYVQDRRNGLLVQPGDPETLGATVACLLHAPGLRARLANGALESVRARHTREAYSRALLECCRSLLS
jgi:glycosyltransferase involved in cell wall biosynthesis